MKVLVTGSAGQLGRALLASVPQGWECTGVDMGAIDLADEGSIRAVLAEQAPDMVINAAAHTAVDRAESEEALAHAVNAHAVGVLAGEMRARGGRLLHVSTDFVFDGSSARAWRPDDAPAPLSAYGRTKLAGEILAGPEATVLRTSWVYAAGGANFVRTMIRLMREREEISVVADQIGAPTWASGLAATLWGLAQQPVAGIFHHRDAGVASWYDFAVAIGEEAEALGLIPHQITVLPITSDAYPAPARRPAFSLLDDSATRALLGDRPPHWRVNLRKMLLEEQALGQ